MKTIAIASYAFEAFEESGTKTDRESYSAGLGEEVNKEFHHSSNLHSKTIKRVLHTSKFGGYPCQSVIFFWKMHRKFIERLFHGRFNLECENYSGSLGDIFIKANPCDIQLSKFYLASNGHNQYDYYLCFNGHLSVIEKSFNREPINIFEGHYGEFINKWAWRDSFIKNMKIEQLYPFQNDKITPFFNSGSLYLTKDEAKTLLPRLKVYKDDADYKKMIDNIEEVLDKK